MSDSIRVLLSTEGTYPFHQGGVSTWCETLVNKMDMVDFVVYSIIGNPFITQKFKLPANTTLQAVPLWGTEEPKEHLDVPFAEIYLPKQATTEPVIRERFLPLFVQVIEELISEVKNPRLFGQLLLELYNFFQDHDYQATFKSEATWEVYKELVLRASADKKHRLSQPDMYGMIQSLGWVYRFFNVVNTPIPKTDVTHSTAAAFCGIPCVIAKLKHGTPFLLTEHGVYLREQYLALSKQPYSSFLSTFLIRMVKSLTSVNYLYADQVSPVCAYNTNWERRFGVPDERIQVIYNGADQNVFQEKPFPNHPNPTVVMIARVDPLKDVKMFLRAAALVHEQFPEARFIVYGSVSVPSYHEECLVLRKEYGIEDVFTFAGHTSNTPAAYASGDIVALTSISEGFPYSVIEAMMISRPVVATDVGGVSEALGDAGLLVPPLDAEAFAEALLKLLRHPELRDSLARDARQRALSFFTLDKVIELYLKSYIKLATRVEQRAPAARRVDTGTQRQKLHLERGMALAGSGLYREAVEQFKAGLREQAQSQLVPVILTELSNAYNALGAYDEAFAEMEKASLVLLMEESNRGIA